MVKHPPASAGDSGLILGSGRKWKIATHSSILKNLMDRGAWRAIAREVTKSQT